MPAKMGGFRSPKGVRKPAGVGAMAPGMGAMAPAPGGAMPGMGGMKKGGMVSKKKKAKGKK